uniref:SV2 related protein b n=1 Tax=Oncorhynchus kisutch TaxID=8019 RepID=A0A8C7EZW2_ONCKI
MMKSRTTCIMLIEVLPVLLAIWIMPTIGWPGCLALCFSICMCKCLYSCLCVILWLPKSARFHVLSGNCYEIVKIVNLRSSCLEDRGRIQDLLTPHYRRITILLWFIWFANAFSYSGLVLMTTELFQAGDACIITQAAKIEPKCNLECNYLTLDDYKNLLWTTSEKPYLFIFYSVSAGVFVTLFVIDRIGRTKSMAMCILPLYSCIGRAALTVFIARAFITGGFQVAFICTPELSIFTVYPTATTGMGIGTCSGVAKMGALLKVPLKKSVYLTLSVYCICCCCWTQERLCCCPLIPQTWACRRLVKSQPVRKRRQEAQVSPTHGSTYIS